MTWSYWLLLAGVVMMVASLTAGGIVEARLWQSDAPWLDSVRAARPFWLSRSLSAIPLTAGFIALLVGLMTGPRGAGLRESAARTDADPVRDMTPFVNRAGEPA
jgi:cbb3-type cytochrome oxidase subunit 1